MWYNFINLGNPAAGIRWLFVLQREIRPGAMWVPGVLEPTTERRPAVMQ
jgi:hypothetical protein